ncbi:conserved phage C-terminal domain-containing protein [Neobacillus drentensis]|uniref:conserved phage C-terminal domain-containing protein n=1 Tax=Neobacillus drentensis TaxID=220684 RepID=UPI002FFE070C
MSKLLINERPLMVIPSMAVRIGFNEALVLQQIHYWLGISMHEIEGRKWVYNSYPDWQRQLPFWSVSTIKRTFQSLENLGYLLSGNWNASKLDQTKWYTIDYQKIEELQEVQKEQVAAQSGQPPVQIEPTIESDWAAQGASLTQAIPEITTEKKMIPFAEIIQYLNDKADKSFKLSSKKTRELIQARVKEGFLISDFKKVIDLKVAECGRDVDWNKYLRPETLFGTKFESYLNQNEEFSKEEFNLED